VGARLLVVAATVPVAIVMNGLRIVVTAVLGAKDPELAEGVFHATAGWVLSFAGFLAVMGAHTLYLKVRGGARGAG
jgi:exosortase/archaeosortase family protein